MIDTGTDRAAADAAVTPGMAPALTPTLRESGRKAGFWLAAAAGALIVAVIALLLNGAASSGGPALGRANAAPTGGMAVAEVLAAEGVDVVTADSLDEALAATSAAQGGATMLVYDQNGTLDEGRFAELADAATHLVIVDPSFGMLQALAPAVGFGGVSPADSAIDAGALCSSPAGQRAGSVAALPGAGLKTLRVPADATGFSSCFTDGDGASVLVQRAGPTGTLSLLADPAILANESVTAAGNAALALGLLGEQPTLVWYLPTLADVAAGAPPSLAELSPGWVTPVMVLLVLTGVAAAIAYGRRFGPLVLERLPVTVRASETMEGRSRLYARNSARLRAVDALRLATIGRIAGRLGLPRTATLDEVVAATAASTGRRLDAVTAVLVAEEPYSDRGMLDLSERLRDLEQAVIRSSQPSNTPQSSSTPSSGASTPDAPSTERMEP
ncbi:DUF4350 domain-containing protein [Microterricola viridarii]|uniref:DUF4350 domain-containing protein n=1 Tax=Microterricola viridarii TaxID=412690 RepID=A0A0Y0MHK9_9MICO|nr:DUF4350 domain-containing protein [Microterricola viridarii]AMB57865.1 hypothetical protein AWU67_02170 [Microterricola viridarii]